MIAEYDEDGDLVWNYVYGLGQRVARYNGSNRQIYHNDHLGNMRAITDTLGAAALATADYYPFGEMLSVTGAPGRFTYNSNELDDEYGFDLYYYGARYMDPSSGRFITPDPVKDFYNPYSYVHNNPMNRIDPTGMVALPQEAPQPATFAGYSMIVPNQIDDVFKDVMSKKELARLLLEKALDNAINMIGTSYDQNGKWEEIASALHDILMGENGMSWEVAPGMAFTGEHENAGAAWSTENKILWLNADYLDGNNDDYVIGWIVHESAHAAFDRKYGKDKSAFDYDNVGSERAEDRYSKASEYQAWKAQMQYHEKYPPRYSRKTADKVYRGYWKIKDAYNKNERAFRQEIENRYVGKSWNYINWQEIEQWLY